VERVHIDLEGDRVVVDGRDVTDDIRTQEIANLTSRLSMLAIVRDKLTPLQRRLASTGGVVLEGRDTGTVVCPEAEVKFYLDASLEERARRRQAELRTRGIELGPEAARREIAARDAQDSSRALAPLRKADDAVEVDTTGLSVDQVVTALADAIERRRRDLPGCG
jgi:CMP/dCMP kinase